MHMNPGSRAAGPGPSERLCVSFTTRLRAVLQGKLTATTV